MGRGRPRKPDSQKRLEGNPGGRPLGGELPAAGKPRVPRGLSDSAKRLAKEIVQSWMGEVDSAQLQVLLETWDLLRGAHQMLKADPTDASARVAYLGYAAHFDRVAAKFGMTPSDRAKIRLPVDRGGDDDEAKYFGVVG